MAQSPTGAHGCVGTLRGLMVIPDLTAAGFPHAPDKLVTTPTRLRHGEVERQALAEAAVHSTAGTFTNAVTAAEALQPELLAALHAGTADSTSSAYHSLNDIQKLLHDFESTKVNQSSGCWSRTSLLSSLSRVR